MRGDPLLLFHFWPLPLHRFNSPPLVSLRQRQPHCLLRCSAFYLVLPSCLLKLRWNLLGAVEPICTAAWSSPLANSSNLRTPCSPHHFRHLPLSSPLPSAQVTMPTITGEPSSPVCHHAASATSLEPRRRHLVTLVRCINIVHHVSSLVVIVATSCHVSTISLPSHLLAVMCQPCCGPVCATQASHTKP